MADAGTGSRQAAKLTRPSIGGRAQTGMNTPAIPADDPATAVAARCENCDAMLQGGYCHACGQSVHSPVRSFRHALEELFESVWHLDGRVFRTLRDLPVPARVACNYLAGHRARYIAPLRLFVILSLLTFFVGQMTVEFGDDALRFDGDGAIANAATVAEVQQHRDRALAEIARGRAGAADMPLVDQPLATAEAEIRKQAAMRIAELQRTAVQPASPDNAQERGPADAEARPPSEAANATIDDAKAGEDAPTIALFDDKPWDARSNPLAVPWLPAFANRWLNHKIGRAVANAPRLKHDRELLKRVVLGSIPTALFVLMPVFALLLKLAYLGKRRLYLEHLVVALYSHAFLLLTLLVIFMLIGLQHWLTAPAAPSGRLFGWLQVALWWTMPIYLLLMQKRVYGQGWPMTLLKYLVLGSAYLMLVTFAALSAGIAGLARL